jgi:ubiquinone/menaquinone biosynthesis C-methylase UbiE
VLEIGCGTGSVLLEVKRRYPDVSATGIDPDPKALARARRKSERARVSIQFDRGFADTLPYADDSFDRVLSSFMLHHVPSSERDGVAREARRVLKAGGALHLVDLAAGHGRTQLVHSEQALAGNAEDRVIALLARAGFDRPSLTGKAAMFFGHIRINYYQAFA